MKSLLPVIMLAMLFCMPSGAMAADYDLLVNGAGLGTVTFSGGDPGQVPVPVRPVLEALGWQVGFDNQSKTVLLGRGTVFIKLPLHQRRFEINGRATAMRFPAVAENNKSYVPLAFFQRAAICRVNWDGQSQALDFNDK
ncbi:copper amine oxidase N-terminal domain-containing protein [Desulfoscipio geothermicus]|uniref:Copper amine oxidase N-terminal domain-containing protein n=1 Tax=Desulfoscipio geothermicus DSM 3669 TaxID=1121426 RepID=A0A1I6DBU1_9FIRM|nr:copper amine oxidase N-terminal domain-containing protein [Desulfoscipio geothermicus]SFR02831.1 Copper amine oxidase N-terminal domain-containing protein [Desulfoscipio geothermicus DSM 3669]